MNMSARRAQTDLVAFAVREGHRLHDGQRGPSEPGANAQSTPGRAYSQLTSAYATLKPRAARPAVNVLNALCRGGAFGCPRP
jgi:hypothetical protein